MKKTMIFIIALGTILMFVVSGCESHAQTDALIGTTIGALAGQAIGGDTEATLIGAGLGGLAGSLIGGEQDRKQMRGEIAAAQQAANTVIVNVTNSNNSITRVILRKEGGMYIGPNGEIYTSLPTEEQLKPVYGF